MKKFGIILSLVLFYLSALSQPKEFYHFKFIEPNRSVVNNTLTNIISIDKVDNDTIYAYANTEEMRLFEKLGYKYSIIPQSSINAKSITMATTVDQMAGWDRYPTYSVYRAMMKKFEHDFPVLCKLDSIGTTNNGHKIYVVKLSKNVSIEEPEVEVFYTSTMHGDETTGFVLMLRLIDYMLSNYSTSTRIASMLDNMAIYINPDANPDGTYMGGDNNLSGAIRYNANYVDINRNFPDPRVSIGPQQVETQIMMNFATSRHFTLSANFHGGAELVNYPWDTWNSTSRTHADNDWFVHVSRQYADSAHAVAPLGYLNQENNGITNGGDWYIVAGGRQDYMNWWHHCREITIELSDVKLLATEQLNNLWNYNRAGLITFLQSATKGFKGVVTNTAGNPIKAKVYVSGHDKDSSHVYSSATSGFYARPIEPGTWQVTYSAKGYLPQTKAVTIVDWNTNVTQDITLEVDLSSVFSIDDINPYQFKASPNPFGNDINFSFNLIKPSLISISIYTIDGRLVKTIASTIGQEGLNTINCADLNGIGEGAYIASLRVGNKSYSQIIQHIR